MFLHLLAILARRLGVDGPEDEAEARCPPELGAHLLTQRDQLVTGHLWRTKEDINWNNAQAPGEEGWKQ